MTTRSRDTAAAETDLHRAGSGDAANAVDAADADAAVRPPGVEPADDLADSESADGAPGRGESAGREKAGDDGGGGGGAHDGRIDAIDADTDPAIGDERIERRIQRLIVGVSLVPLVAAAVMLVFGVGDSWMPASDQALTELQVRDVGRHEVLVGLYSRADWNHPGPALFYALAPFYWVSGGASIGMSLGALAINGAALVGLLAVARRHGGTALMATTALGCALMLRATGAQFVHDPWNCFVTTLPFGLTILLTWSMVCGWRWALPLGLGVAACIAQAHVGFVALALPLAAAGGVVLVARSWRSTPAGDGGVVDRARRTGLVAPLLVAAGVQAVLWAPVLVDVVVNAPSNLNKTIRWFREGEGGTQSLGNGISTLVGQFGLDAEWLGGKLPTGMGGEGPFMNTAPFPWLLLPIALAAIALWRWAGAGRWLVLTLGAASALSIAAIVRTVGPAFDYRLRWVWMVAVLVAAAAAWAGIRAVANRSRLGGRVALGVVGVAFVAVSTVNVVTGATAGTPHEGDSDAIAALMPAILDEVDGTDGQVLVTDVYATGVWYGRGMVLQLERRGIDARVDPDKEVLFGERRVLDGDPDVTLVVATNDSIDVLAGQQGMRKLDEWRSVPADLLADVEEQRAALDEGLEDGTVTSDQHVLASWMLYEMLAIEGGATYHRVAVFVREG